VVAVPGGRGWPSVSAAVRVPLAAPPDMAGLRIRWPRGVGAGGARLEQVARHRRRRRAIARLGHVIHRPLPPLSGASVARLADGRVADAPHPTWQASVRHSG
jgi:hypothetical protein